MAEAEFVYSMVWTMDTNIHEHHTLVDNSVGEGIVPVSILLSSNVMMCRFIEDKASSIITKKIIYWVEPINETEHKLVSHILKSTSN